MRKTHLWARGTPDLGLAAGDVIDALCVQDNGNGVYDGSDIVMVSLAPGSPSLSSRGYSAADVILAGSRTVVFFKAASIGLLSGDNLDGLSCAFEIKKVYLPVIKR